MFAKDESQSLKILTLSVLFDVMEIKETIWICSGLKSTVIKYTFKMTKFKASAVK